MRMRITAVSVGSFIILFGLNLTIQTLYYLLQGVIIPIPPHTRIISGKRLNCREKKNWRKNEKNHLCNGES